VRRLCGEDVELYIDWGISGRRDDRPDYLRLKADIASGRVTSVCAYSLSRLGRSARELLSFIDLCQKAGVPVRTAVESIDTSTAMGRAMLTVMAAFAQLEVEQGMERSAAARAARKARHDAAGLPTPPSTPIYGQKAARDEADPKLWRLVPDPERPIEPVLDAYRQAGTVRGACELLTSRGIPAPEGGKVWGSSTLRRILDHYIPEALPEAGRHGRRVPVRTPALFAGLLSCHCGRRMTPNLARGQYYCSAGASSGTANHGRMSVTERALVDALRPEAERYMVSLILDFGQRPDAVRERERLEARKERTLTAFTAGAMPEARWRAETAAIDAKLAELARQDRTLTGLRMETVPDWSDVPAMNAHLRRIWLGVDLDVNMTPTVRWAVPEYLYDEGAAEAYAAASAYPEG
jgi:Resolvase, N terminal domain